MKSKVVARKDISIALGAIKVDEEFLVGSPSDRQEALRIGKNFRDGKLVTWVLRTWGNSDGTLTIRAVNQ